MASTNGWLKEQMLGLRRQPGGDAGWGTVQVAQAGDARAEKYLQGVGMGTNSVGTTSVAPPAMPAIDPNIGASPIDRRGPDFGVPPNPGKRSMATDAIQLAQADTGPTPEQLEFMRRMDPAAMKQRPAPAKPAPAPAPTTPDPLNLKKNLDQRMQKTGLEGPVYTAARGGMFDEGDEVLVGEEGPEVVKFGEPGAVIPAAAAAGVLGVDKKKVDAVSKAAKAAGGKAVDATKQGLRTGANWVVDKFGTASRAGATVGQGVNAAQAGAEALPELMDEFKQGYRGARGASARPAGVNPNVGPDARAFQASRGTFPGGQPLPGTPGASAANLTKMGELRLYGGQAARFAGKALPGAAAVMAGGEAVDMTGAVGRGEFAATPENRMARGLRILSGGLIKPAGSGPGAQPPAPPQNGMDNTQSGSVGAPDEAGQRAADLEIGKLEAQIQANRAIASPEAGGTGVSVGGLRYAGQGVRPARNAMEALGRIGSYGAASRMALNEAETGLKGEAIDVARERNRISAAAARATLLQAQRKQATAEEESGAKRLDETIKSAGIELTGKQKESSFGFGGESKDQFAARLGTTTADLRGDIMYSVGNRKDGKKPGDLSQGEVQQLLLGKKLKDKFNAGRADTVQFVRDFLGNKQFNSRDLYSYMPATGPKGELLGADISALPTGGSFLLRAKNGNTMTATRGIGGEWNLLSPNGPVDADIAALFSKHLDAAAKRAKGGR